LRHSEAAKGYFQEASKLLQIYPFNNENRLCQAKVYGGMASVLEGKNLHDAVTWLQKGLEIIGNINLDEVAHLRLRLSTIWMHLGQYELAQKAAQNVLDLLPIAAYERHIGALMNLGGICANRSDFTSAGDYYEEALVLSTKYLQDFRSTAILANLGYVKYVNGEWQISEYYYQNGIDLAMRLGDNKHQLRLHNGLGMLHIRLGNHESALEHLIKAMKIVQMTDMQMDSSYILSSKATLYIQKMQLNKAMACLKEAESIALEMEIQYVLVEINLNWSQIYLLQCQVDQAAIRINKALKLSRELQMSLEEGVGLRTLGQIHAIKEEDATIITSYFQKSLDMLTGLDLYETARTQTAWGEWLWHYVPIQLLKRWAQRMIWLMWKSCRGAELQGSSVVDVVIIV